MGAGASAGSAAFKAGVEEASPDELQACVGALDPPTLKRLQQAVAAVTKATADAEEAADPIGYKKRQLMMAASGVCRLKGEQIESIMEGYDPAKELDKEEFGALWTKLGFSTTFMEGYFKAMDTDGSGKLSYQQLLGGLAAASSEDLDATAALLMKVYDTNGNGTLCKDEFVATIKNATKVMKAGIEAALNSLADDALQMLQPMAEMNAALAQMETAAAEGNENNENSDAIVEAPPPAPAAMPTRDDLIAQMMAEAPEVTEPTAEEIDAMFKEIDLNTDGQISLEELKKLMAADADSFKMIFQPTLMVKDVAGQMEGGFVMGMMGADCSIM